MKKRPEVRRVVGAAAAEARASSEPPALLTEEEALEREELEEYNKANREPAFLKPGKPFNLLNLITKPHTVTVLVLMCGVMTYLAFTRDKNSGTEANLKMGIGSACLAFIIFCMLQLKDGEFTRPHPLVWRAVTGMSLLYMMLLIVLFFTDVDDARQWVKFLDPSLGKPLPERDYAAHCEIYTPNDPSGNPFKNVYDAVLDEFFLGHIIAWWCKTLLIRDVKLVLVASVLFEVIELTFQHLLPNFAECWWDHIVLDIILCNGLGIVLGHYTLRWLKMREYNFVGITKIKSTKGKFIRVLTQFTPASWTQYHWGMFSSFKRFVLVMVVLLAVNLVDLGAFFLKFLLWIPPPHPINIVRLCVIVLLCAPGLREFYQYLIDPDVHMFGPAVWIDTAIILLEILVSVKWGRGVFLTPMPFLVKLGWGITFAALGLFCSTYFPIRWYLERKRFAQLNARRAQAHAHGTSKKSKQT
eukprot:TRINITY_DN977_c0_g1_i1.p1 TRINITY_DN977_c0_g1~~TRINITY_DN977_c0_g1_i1.p1  ORF type:complete len:487 (-),score=160.17 TRINITY_DN977_c0_g1_i1:75-1484(-)